MDFKEVGLRGGKSHVCRWQVRISPVNSPPLATFLRSKHWIAANTQEGLGFRRADQCWAARARRGGPPKFVDRVPDTFADFTEGDELAELAFGEDLGIRDWLNPDSAVERLKNLAAVSNAAI